jgi:transposase
MNFTHNTNQNSLFQFGLMEIDVPQEHDLIKMEKEISWNEMIEIVSLCYSSTKGRNTKSLRMMIALEIAKRKYGKTDEEIIEQLKSDVALKVFCGFSQWDHDVPHSSSMTKFRKRLDTKTLMLLEEAWKTVI